MRSFLSKRTVMNNPRVYNSIYVPFARPYILRTIGSDRFVFLSSLERSTIYIIAAWHRIFSIRFCVIFLSTFYRILWKGESS